MAGRMPAKTSSVREIEAILDRHRNELVVPGSMLNAFMIPAREIAMQSTGSGFSISAADLADLVALRDQVVGFLAGWFDRLIALAGERRRNLVRYDGIGVVSLGCDCLSRAVLARWGLKKTAKLGEKSGPFDLAVHYPETVARLLADGFSGYLDPDQLAYRDQESICVHSDYLVTFNHEVGQEYAADEFRKLRDIYSRRIVNLHAALADLRPVGLVVHVPHFIELTPTRVDCLKRTLDLITARRQRPTSMIVINSHVPGQPVGVEEQAVDGFLLRHVPMPQADYVWHWPQCYMSDDGHAYERQVATIVAERLDQLITSTA